MSRIVAAALVAAFAFSACQDPAGVGIGLIDEETSDPNVRVVPLADLDTLQTETIAIGFASSSLAPSQARVLVGNVEDAIFGDARAVAYVDFLQPSIDDEVEVADIGEVWLELRRDYAYGDTTTVLPIDLAAVQGSWEVETDYPVDTLFSTGAVLSTTDVSVASDSLQRFDLPATWVADNAATLIGDGFGDAFEGFALSRAAMSMPSPGVVWGFSTFAASGSGLRVALPDDTLFFPLSEVFSSVAGGSNAPSSSDVIPVRASSRQGLQFTASLDGTPTAALARATVRIPYDASLALDGSFVRPLAVAGLLVGVRLNDEGEEVRVGLGQIDLEDGIAQLTDSRVLTTSLQALLLDPTASRFIRYEVVPIGSLEVNAASFNVFPVIRPTVGSTTAPRLTLTIVGGTTPNS